MAVSNDKDFIEWVKEELKKAQAVGNAINWRLSETPTPADPFQTVEVKPIKEDDDE